MSTSHSMRAIFFCNDTATTEISTLSLHDALPISWQGSTRPVLLPPRDTVRASQTPPGVATDTAPPTRRAPEPVPARASREPARVRVAAPPPAAATESAVHPPVAQRDD